MNKFKIDIYDSPHFPFALYRLTREGTWWQQERWVQLERFGTRDEAKAFYEKIKNLPEYLN